VRRADEAPGYVVPAEQTEISSAARDRLKHEFLGSLEGAGFGSDGEEAYAVSLAIDFCADYVDRRPLRWSPVVVELFMADWLPRKVLADRAVFESVPSALDAWVRFAGRKSGTPEWAIEQTCEAIPRWRDEMHHSLDNASGGPSGDFLRAARDAGVELEDRAALETFIAGWNARSLLE